MADAFPKPKKAMGEAWFLGERRMFPELLGNIEELTNEQIWAPLEEMAGGPSCFGRHEEWTEWFHYLLPRLVTRDWRPSVYDPAGLLITCFVAQHPDSNGAVPYSTFRSDALVTLGQYLMSSYFWHDGAVDIERCLHKYESADGTREWYDCGGSLSAALFFCLKYLPVEGVAPWFESVIAIKDPYWIEQIIVWLIGAHPILTSTNSQPAGFPEYGPYRVSWDWSHVLSGNYSGDFQEPVVRIPFLPRANCDALLEVVRNWSVGEFFEELLTDPKLEAVAAETPGLSDRFFELYGEEANAG
jgi:hypothetical protein